MTNSHIIQSLDQLEGLYGKPKDTSLKKEVTELNDVYRRWLEQASFFALASVGSDGLDCTPRGDARSSAFHVADNSTLIIPDRRGNNRIDTMRNIVEDPRVALLFLIPGINEALRINGTAVLSTEPALLQQFDMNGALPISCVIVTIGSVYFQCARAIMRSELWNPENRVAAGTVPTAGEMVKSGSPDFDAAAYDKELAEYTKGTLY